MPNLRIQSPLQFPGYTQTLSAGLPSQVLTYTDGQATWQSVPGGLTPDQLPCFFTYFLNGLQVQVPAVLYAVNGAIPAFDEDPQSTGIVRVSKPIPIINNQLPCRVFTNGVYVDDNINLRS